METLVLDAAPCSGSKGQSRTGARDSVSSGSDTETLSDSDNEKMIQKKVGDDAKAHTKPSSSTTIFLSLKGMLCMLALCVASSFSIGYIMATKGLINAPQATDASVPQQRNTVHLPPPPLFEGKDVPTTSYTAQLFGLNSTVRSSSALLNAAGPEEYVVDENGNQKCAMTLDKFSKTKEGEEEEDNPEEASPEEDNEVHQPAGQHLLVDMKNLDAAFLDSEERLALAMIDVVKQSELTLLSYHCHGLEPAGVSCVGVLLESHVSFHTWPSEGVITLDLFTCGPKSLLPMVQTILKLFGVARDESEVEVVWSHKKRGFRYFEENHYLEDLDRFLGDVDEEQEEILSVETESHKVDVYDTVNPRLYRHKGYRRSLPKAVEKDRLVFVDDVLVSRRYGEHAFHEALVHPVMIAHKEPERVLILGGGLGGALREVLKHNTVDEVVVIEEDEALVNISRHYLHEWNDCSSFLPGYGNCFDHPSVELIIADPFEWIEEEFECAEGAADDHFDVVIFDGLDFYPQEDVFTEEVAGSLFRSLSEMGLAACPLGEVEKMGSLPDTLADDGVISDWITDLEKVGFLSINEYEEMHGKLGVQWRFIGIMKDEDSRADWTASEAEVSLKLSQRILQSISAGATLLYFDGATMMNYAVPSRIAEDRFCMAYPYECDGDEHTFSIDVFKSDVEDHPISNFEVRVVEDAGRGVFTKVDLKEGDYLSLDECVNQMYVPPFTELTMEQFAQRQVGAFWKTFVDGYIEGYGLQGSFYGLAFSTVDPGILTFINHGCNGSYNIGHRIEGTEATIELGTPIQEVNVYEWLVYNPHSERRFHSEDCTELVAIQDIPAGTEIRDNYVFFGGWEDQEDFDLNLADLKSMCSGQMGTVQQYESKR